MVSRRARASTPGPRFCKLASLGILAALSLLSEQSQACGPCSVPEVWGLQELAGEPVVVTNFGLLSRTDDGWRLTCEEAIGGLLLNVRGDATASLVSTRSGVFEQAGDLCEWDRGPTLSSNEWALRFSLPPVASDQAGESFALVIDLDTSELQVERSTGNDDFAVVHTFGNTSGYRELVAGGEPAAVFVTGYTLNPRTWNVAYSLDSGESWNEVSPEVDNDYATMFPRLVDPESPNVLLIHAETTPGEGDEIWRFDSTDDSVEMVLKMEDGDVYQGMTFDGDSLWVAGRRRAGGTREVGSLYRARRDDLVFERVVEEGPPFSCLDAREGALFACVNEFTLESEFLLGRSTDEGQTWEPELTVDELARIDSCGDVCCATLEWLTGLYEEPGSTGEEAGLTCSGGQGGAGASEVTGGNGGTGGGATMGGAAGDDSAQGGGQTAGSSRGTGGGGCSCASAPGTGGHPLALAGLLLLGWMRRRRPSKPAARRRRGLAAVCTVALLACSNGGGAAGDDTSGAAGALGVDGDHDADCRALGAELSHLKLETENGSSLEFLEQVPDPPVVGVNSWLVELRDDSGDLLSGLEDAIFVTPFMPEHGHGTPTTVGVVEEQEGQYRLSPVNTFMPGLWQITLEIDAGTNTEQVEFEVCVE